jgi:hypothetical protein
VAKRKRVGEASYAGRTKKTTFTILSKYLMTALDKLTELLAVLDNATTEVQTVVDDFDGLTEEKRRLKIGQLLLTLDVMLLMNRKKLDEIRGLM